MELKADPIRYRIPITGIKTSTNKFYAGTHWAKRKELKDSVLGYAAGFCRPVQKVESYPVEISYRFIFSSRPLDTLNCAIMAKMFEDAFRSLGVLEDDDIRYVTRSILEVAQASSPEGKAKASGQGKKTNAKNDDWLEITINSLK